EQLAIAVVDVIAGVRHARGVEAALKLVRGRDGADHVGDLDAVVVERGRQAREQRVLQLRTIDEAQRPGVRRLFLQVAVAADEALNLRAVEDIAVDSGRRQALGDAEIADLGRIRPVAVGAADVARVAAIDGLTCGVHRAADLRRADVAVAEQFADGGRTHGALDAAATPQTVDNGPVDVRLIGRNPADGAVVGVAIAQVQVQRLDERLIGQDRDQGLDEDFGRVGRTGQRLNRVEPGDFHAADLAAVRQAVRAQVVDDRIALRQAGVRTEGEGVFAILTAQGDADFAGRQLEQTALHGRL